MRRKLNRGWEEVKFSNVFECFHLWIVSYWNSRYKIKNMITHVSSRLVSSVALLSSISFDKFDIIFLSSSRKNVFNIKHLIYVYIIFIGQRTRFFKKRQLFSTHANLMHCGNLLWCKSLSHFCISINFGEGNQKMTLFTLCNCHVVGTIQHSTETLEIL